MDGESNSHSAKRFRHRSYQATLKEVHLPSALAQSDFDREIGDDESHFFEAIRHWRQLNLSPAFIQFATDAASISSSMPLLVHHWSDVVQLWLSAIDTADDEALVPLLDLMQKFTHDLRSIVLPSYNDLLHHLLQLLRRSIPAAALTTLLATFTSLFKHVLVTSNEPHILERTWKLVRIVLPECNSEVQRAMAEVWGSLLRRLRASRREAAVELMAEDLSGVEGACTWAYIFTCKSVSQTLHTATPSVLSPLLRAHLRSREHALTHTCLRRLLTALIHHCKGAEEFLPISELLTEKFTSMAKLTESSKDPGGLDRIIEIIATVVSVRQGSRMTADQLSKITMMLSSLFQFSSLGKSLLHASASVLIAGDESLWMGPGRALVQQSWTNLTFGAQLCGILSDLLWGGWRLLELPHMVNNLPDLLDVNRLWGLALLASLHRGQRLKNVPVAWLHRLEEWVLERFENWAITPENVEEFRHLLQVTSLLPGALPLLCKTIAEVLDAPDPKENYQNYPATASWVLGSCLRTLATLPHVKWAHHANVVAWTEKVLQRWTWSEIVLDGLAELIRKSPAQIQSLSLEDIYPCLASNVLSHSRRSRLCALYILSSSLVRMTPSQELVLSRLLQAEEVPIDVQSSRERVLRVKQLESIIPANDTLVSELAVRWVVAQLKVGLRPVWLPTAQVLEKLSERCGEVVWQVVFGELKAATSPLSVEAEPDCIKAISDEDVDVDEVRESERSWRDPSAYKVRSAWAKWSADDTLRIQFIRDQEVQDRFDRITFEAQLLVVLKHCAPLAEKHNRDLVPLFLDLSHPFGPSKLPRTRLAAWLTLFSNFTNPRVLHSTQTLHDLYNSLLSHPDRSLQGIALSCLLTYKPPYLLPYVERLRGLLDDSRWRDELAQLDIANISGDERPALIDAVIRMLFGFVRERRTRDRRATVLATLGGCTNSELDLLVTLMLQAVLPAALESTNTGAILPVPGGVSLKHQIGFLHLLGDVLKQLGPRLVSRWHALIIATVSLAAHSQSSLEALRQEKQDIEEDVETPEEEAEDVDPQASSPKQLRVIRQLGFRRFADFFWSSVSFDFEPYMKEAFRTLFSPRLASFTSENTQAPSALLEIFYVWSSDERYVGFLVDHDERVLPQIYACLTAPSVKPTVIARVLDIVDRLLALSASHEGVSQRVVRPHVSVLLTNLATLVQDSKGDAVATDQLAQRQISILSGVAHYISDGAQASVLLRLFASLLRKPTKQVGERTKAEILKIMANLLPLIPDLVEPLSSTYILTFELVSSLFQSVRSRQCRMALIALFHAFSAIDVSLKALGELLEQLNAYSKKRIEEPDFERRLEAFAKLNETLHASLTPTQWMPILYNLLYCIQDPDELAIRSNSSLGFKHFIDAVSAGSDLEYRTVFLRRLFPGLKNGLRSKNEMVRAEVLGVISYAVTRCGSLTTLQDMTVLLEGGDDEANFFYNIYHVQLHRRIRALNRLVDHCNANQLHSSTLADIFVPLVGNFIIASPHTDHHLATAAITAMGHMARQLAWGPYYVLVLQYLKLLKVKDASERLYVRTIVAILDGFHFPMDNIAVPEPYGPIETAAGPEGAEESVMQPAQASGRIADAVNQRLLPVLLKHLENRNEAEDTIRIPISVGIAKIALHLPGVIREAQVSKLITVLSQCLRSKSSETRDLTRDTLCKITTILGPSYLPKIIGEMRGALIRGPQLHVLAYVTHALLTHVTKAANIESFKNLDNCVEDVAHISAEVIFGEPGKDLQSEGFKTKMREVRSSGSKGLDSLAIVAKFITPSKISSLLRPLRAIMQETEALKVMLKVDDVLRSQDSKFQKHVRSAERKGKRAKGNAIVELKRNSDNTGDHYAINSFRFIVFGLDLFNTAFRRNRFDFGDTDILARLESMVAVIGNTLYSSNSHVVIQGLKASAAIVKCPLKGLENSVPIFVRQTIDILKQAGSTESEVAQTALKSLAVVVRDKSNAEVKEKDLAYLLELLAPDLEEPGRQASVFAMLRAIVSRKFIVPEIYDLMDQVAEVMVTNQSTQVQELCRGVLLQFLLDYPQGKGRLRTTMTFLAKNTAYTYESGRISVLELLSAIVSKFEATLISDYADLLFIALVMVTANDDSAKSREMAAEIIKTLFCRLDVDRRRLLMSHLRSWASQRAKPQLIQVVAQVYGIILDALQADASIYLSVIVEDLNANILRSVEQLAREDDDEQMDVNSQWQVVYQALNSLGKAIRIFPDTAIRPQMLPWPAIVTHLLFPHAWVRMAAARLLGQLFSAIPVEEPFQEGHPATSPMAGLDLKEIAAKHCTQLESPHLNSALGLQIVKNLFYIGKCFCVVKVSSSQPAGDEASEGEDEGNPKVREDDHDEVAKQDNPLAWLFSKLSYQIRSAYIDRRSHSASSDNWHEQPAAIFRFFAAMANYMEGPQLEGFLMHILSPIYRITEDDAIGDQHMDELKTTAIELQDLVQRKVGTTKFASTYNKIRQGVLEIQRERRTARVTKFATHPEAAARRKQQRSATKRESRKRKNVTFA
ncbi:armadillo-type protein [Multifurca ochricompacta]|uniref:Armadillo-type protein n=1 Tax=Multifurca ochricompacta TaxID=376703 RepID=A0AAD4M6I6_9AGAM|nr:armadillo-type protein [Multifurca ochricompacta]